MGRKEKGAEREHWRSIGHTNLCQGQPVLPRPQASQHRGPHPLLPQRLYPGGRETRIFQLVIFPEAKPQENSHAGIVLQIDVSFLNKHVNAIMQYLAEISGLLCD